MHQKKCQKNMKKEKKDTASIGQYPLIYIIKVKYKNNNYKILEKYLLEDKHKQITSICQFFYKFYGIILTGERTIIINIKKEGV